MRVKIIIIQTNIDLLLIKYSKYKYENSLRAIKRPYEVDKIGVIREKSYLHQFLKPCYNLAVLMLYPLTPPVLKFK